MKKKEISIIIVYYKIKKELFACIESIIASDPKMSYEIIVVDNDEKKTLASDLLQRHPKVRYIPNPVNNGWGGGTNIGAKYAQGTYLFFLNPDTLVQKHAIDNNLLFLKMHKKIGVVSSLLLNKDRIPYPLQGTQSLTPLRALVAFSFLNKRMPNNPISSKFWYLHIDRSKPFNVDIAPLSASLIKKSLFKKVEMLDESYFLYFEEYDLGKKINALGYVNYINTNSQVIHFWEGSTKYRRDRDEIMIQSRKHYFTKYYGQTIAHMIEMLLGIKRKAKYSAL